MKNLLLLLGLFIALLNTDKVLAASIPVTAYCTWDDSTKCFGDSTGICKSIDNKSECLSSRYTYLVSTNSNALVDTMCNVLRIVTGNGGKAFAAFAIISVGIGFFTGKVSWGLMVGVAMGIAAMFGAPTIVAAISGDSAYDCTI